MKKISVVIPVYNALDSVKHCIKSVVKRLNFAVSEVLIVDDCSSEKTRKYLEFVSKKYKDKLSLYRNKTNLGYLRSCNLAAEKAEGEIIVFLNSDCEIPSLFAERILHCFESNKEIMAASPISSNSANYFVPLFMPLEVMNLFFGKVEPEYPDVYNSEGFCFCVRKSFIDKFELFDTVYGAGYAEEVDFSFKVKTNGGKCVLIDNLYVKHLKQRSFGKSRAHLLTRNNKILYKKWAELINKADGEQMYNPVNGIVKRAFKNFAPVVILLIKLVKQFRPNRVNALVNIFKNYNSALNSRKIIYTCICGKSDIIPVIHTFYNPEWQYICFTDNKKLISLKKFGMWKILPLKFDKSDNTKNARWHKTHPHILFPDSEETIWVDANINILTPYLFETIKNRNSDLLIPVHYCRNCVFQEFDSVKRLNRDSAENIQRLRGLLISRKMPQKYGLNETNIIYRKNHKENIDFIMEQWWQIIENYSKRDQLSLSYIFWKNNIKVEEISIPNIRIDVENFGIYPRNGGNNYIDCVLRFVFQ